MVNIHQYWVYIMSNKARTVLYVGITNEGLIDNYYLIVEYKRSIYDDRRGTSKKLSKSNSIYENININNLP